MANTTSGTTTFDKTFSIDEIIEESFERIGLNCFKLSLASFKNPKSFILILGDNPNPVVIAFTTAIMLLGNML